MKNKVLTTFAFGEQADLLDISLPTFRRYAAHHGYDLVLPREQPFERPWPWFKVLVLLDLLKRHDHVLWLDADVVVCRFDKDIMDDAGDEPTSVVVHRTPDGEVPNTGVWIVNAGAVPLLKDMWHRTKHARCQCWWEQAAFIAALGGDPDQTPNRKPQGGGWGELPYEWNPHINDERGVPNDCRFFHATMMPDRKAAMRNAAWRSREAG